jgi:PAS domain S-box-containing protein
LINTLNLNSSGEDKNKSLALLLQHEGLQHLADISEDLIFSLNDSGCFQFVNASGVSQLNYSVEELSGRHLMDFISPEERSSFIKSFQSLIDSGSLISFEITLITKNDDKIRYHIRAKTFTDQNGSLGIVGIGKNMTKTNELIKTINELNTKLIELQRLLEIEKSRLRQQTSFLEELNRMKNEFLSNISHEMRTPLASIIGFSESIVSDPSMTPEMRHEFNQIILEEGKRLSKLINDVMDLSSLEEGRIALNKSTINIVKLLGDLIQSHKNVLERKELVLNYELPKEGITIEADRARISEVFNILLNNAIKFTPKGGRIGIFFHTFHREIEVIITDTGVGIAKKDIPYIFRKFYQDKKTSKQGSESGLGLVFVKQIVDLHGGSITIQSDLNQGTTIAVKLPVKVKQQ